MRSSNATNRTGEPHGDIPRRLDSSGGLCNNAGVVQLPQSRLADSRHLAIPAEKSRERRRLNLARLIGLVSPEKAVSIADALISEFGSLAKTMAETPEAQRRVIGDHENVIGLLNALWNTTTDGYLGELLDSPINGPDQQLINYLVADLGFRPNETLRILFLDSSNHLINDEIIAEGTVRQLHFYPRRIFKRAFEVNASALIIAHNHPGGSPKPSGSDIQATKTIVTLGASLDLAIHDHIIVAGHKWSSFKAAGLMS